MNEKRSSHDIRLLSLQPTHRPTDHLITDPRLQRLQQPFVMRRTARTPKSTRDRRASWPMNCGTGKKGAESNRRMAACMGPNDVRKCAKLGRESRALAGTPNSKKWRVRPLFLSLLPAREGPDPTQVARAPGPSIPYSDRRSSQPPCLAMSCRAGLAEVVSIRPGGVVVARCGITTRPMPGALRALRVSLQWLRAA